MKTPMQELLELEAKLSKRYVDESVGLELLCYIRKNSDKMLEKEKEVMCEFADDYQRNCFQKSTDDYYNETFNTEEK